MKKNRIFVKRRQKTAWLLAIALFASLFAGIPVRYARAADSTISESMTLTADQSINGNLTMADGAAIDLNGHTLTVTGNFYHQNGLLNIDSGTLKVGGFYYCRRNNSCGSGELRMQNKDGLVDVDGNVTFDTDCKESWKSEGKLRIGGDLTVSSPDGGKGYAPYYNHVTEFKSNKTHTVSFNENTNNYLNKVSVTDGGKLLLTGETTGFTLDSDMTLADGSTLKGSRGLSLSEHTLKVDGSFTQDGTLTITVTNSLFDITGTYYHSNGLLNVGDGTVKIGGDYYCRRGSSCGSGELRMQGSDGLVDVDGDVTFDTDCKESWKSEGKLRIGGDLTVSSPNGGKGYAPYYNHVTEFKGSKKHTVSFNENTNNYLNKVSVTDDGKLFLTGKTTGFALDSDMAFTDGSTLSGDRELSLNGYTLKADGSFTQDGPAINTADSSMDVAGTFYHYNGILNVGTGTIRIGNAYYCRRNSSCGSGELRMQGSDGLVDVDGDVTFDTDCKENWKSEGKLRIGGNLNVSSPNSGKGYAPYYKHVTEFKGGKKHTAYFSDENNYTNAIQLGIGDSVEFTGAMNGIVRDSSSSISIADDSIASISEKTITGKKEGESTLTFKNASTNVTKNLIVGKTNTATLPPFPTENPAVSAPTATAAATAAPTATEKPTSAPAPTQQPTAVPTATRQPAVIPTATQQSATIPTATQQSATIPTATASSSANGTPAPTPKPAASGTASQNASPSSVPTSPAGAAPTVKPATTKKPAASKDDSDVTELETGSLGKPSLSSIRVKKGGTIKIKLKPISRAKGYQIQYSTKKSFKKSATKTKTTKKTTYTIKHLKKNKTYYIRARAYRLKGKKKKFGKWGAVKRVKAK